MINIYLKPSFYAHILNAILIIAAVIISVINYNNINKLEPYKIIILLLLFAIVIGIHSLTHLGLELAYNFNPLEYSQNKNILYDK